MRGAVEHGCDARLANGGPRIHAWPDPQVTDGSTLAKI